MRRIGSAQSMESLSATTMDMADVRSSSQRDLYRAALESSASAALGLTGRMSVSASTRLHGNDAPLGIVDVASGGDVSPAGRRVPRGRPRPMVVLLAVIVFIVVAVHVVQVLSVGESTATAPPAAHVPSTPVYYGVVIDCGSSGSRVFVYEWPEHSGDAHDLLRIRERPKADSGAPAVLKVEPGVSSYADRPGEAYVSLRPLLDFAVQHLPSGSMPATQLFIYATAGMRLLPDTVQQATLAAIVEGVQRDYAFPFDASHVSVITGKLEGIYGWVAVNYALGRLSAHTAAARDVRTVGVLDMGGGSMQVTIEVPLEHALPGEYAVDVNLGCQSSDMEHTYRLYTATHLGFGANEARRRYVMSLVSTALANTEAPAVASATAQPAAATSADAAERFSEPVFVDDPCLPCGAVERVDTAADGTAPTLLLFLIGTGDYDACRAATGPLLQRDATCTHPPCAFGGIHQPALDFSALDFYGLSEYWYTTRDVYGIDGVYDSEAFDARSRAYCASNWTTLVEDHEAGRYPNAGVQRMRMQCFKAAWLSQVLHEGYGAPVDGTRLVTAETVRGVQVSWTLGVMVYATRFFPLQRLQQQLQLRQQAAQAWFGGGHLSMAIGTPLLLLATLTVFGGVCLLWLALLGRRRQRAAAVRGCLDRSASLSEKGFAPLFSRV